MLGDFHPLVAAWFAARYGEPTEPQVQGWPLIRAGRDVLISAPTGSGKTLAAFSLCLDSLVRRAAAGPLPDSTLVVYVSPLKALTNDIRKNLETPLGELLAAAETGGTALAPIRTATRTGDTPQAERARMLRKPPHVLVTTPESLFILLTAEKSRRLFAGVETIIVDEIHALAADKRGSHLALTLARLDELVRRAGGPKPQRIGLSATVRPLEQVAEFLSPSATVVDVGHRRAMDLHVEVPNDELGPVASNEMWGEIYDRVAEHVRNHRTTLIFVSTRRMSERVAFALAARLGEDVVLPHHGSLSREKRFEAEDRLKKGELRAVVATASLELGIDIGSVDLVVQLGTPRSIAVALQRIGRSGHWVGAKPEGRLFATTRDELLECAALVRGIRGGAMDALVIPSAPLDILAQQLVAFCAAEDEWEAGALYEAVRAAYPYRDLSRKDFDEVVTMLADGVATSRGRSGAFLHHDRVNGRLRARRGARMAAITSGGAIPETANYNVVAEPDGHVVGTVDEDFAVESMAGDIFLLGSTSWQIRRVESGVVRVENANGAPPSIPFWNGESPGRTIELSREVSALRAAIDQRDDAAAIEWLTAECCLDRAGAEQAVAYVRAGKAILGTVPTGETIVAERFFDEGGGMQLILHTPFGARINRAWGLALRKKFCRSFNLELQAAATDNGICLSLTDQHAFPLEIVFEYVKSAGVEHTLTQAMLDAPMFGARWRWNATRALAILRMRGGKKVAPQLQRMRADDLLASVFPDQAACAENLSGPIRIPDHVLVRETIDNCLHEAMDLDGLLEVLRAVESGAIRTVAVDTPEPSPFCHEILNANPYAYLDDAPLEERRARAVTLRRTTRADANDGSGILDPAAIAEVTESVWPVVRDADELHDALATLTVLPAVPEWQAWFDELVAQRRATTLSVPRAASAADGAANDAADGPASTGGSEPTDSLGPAHGSSRDVAEFWTCAERLDLARVAYPDAVAAPEIATLPSTTALPESRADAFTEILRGWLESSGPLTVAEMTERFAVDVATVEFALLELETEGQLLRGRFRPGVEGEQWCNRRVLARIHRLTLGTLRREIEPVTTAEFVRFLFRWQHVAPTARLHGIDGTLHVVKQLEGYEIPAAAWESAVLPARVAGYKREYLDRLCYAGDVMWGRLSPHPALAPDEDKPGRKVRPTKLAPIALFARENAEALVLRGAGETAGLSHAAREVLAEIGKRGAPFFADIVRGTKRLPAEVEEALWQLVAAGLVSADGFDALRSLIDAKRRLGDKGLRARPRSSSGRWTLLASETERIDADAFARKLLARWGVVFRDVVARETLAPPWRELLGALRRMEARGEIRGGRFVAGYVGEQFALPEALDALRAARRAGSDADVVEVGAYDPLQLAAGLLAGPRPVRTIARAAG
ncbi:MAG: ATP-dependent helicase Lhr and Lhr-like helicase [Candidatus Eremiobacteraeota bacterium]|nr:ATP-dependent helicase Lhr and Lhr-like helicase [Candidatus Eremiobacteraeota bacterium]